MDSVPIALARVRLLGGGLNICGVSAQTFVAREAAQRGDQTQGVVDYITLIGDKILFEREGRSDELLSLASVAVAVPLSGRVRDSLLPPAFVAARRLRERVAEAASVTPQPAACPSEPGLCDAPVPEPAAAAGLVEPGTDAIFEPIAFGTCDMCPPRRGPGRPRKLV